jgi:ZIP family zinc transporter
MKDIFLLGLLAGGPTILGTVVSAHGVSSYLSVGFFTLAAGSLLYVIVSLIAHSSTIERRLQTATGLFVGICVMYLSGMALARMIGIQT